MSASAPTLNATTRTVFGSKPTAKARAAGKTPASVSRKGQDSLQVLLDTAEAVKVLKPGVHLVNLAVDGAVHQVLVQEIHKDCLKDTMQQVDLIAVSAGSQARVEIPLRPNTLNCPGIKAGGIVEQMVRKIKISCPVQQIPEAIVADLSATQLNQTLYAKDLQVPAGVKVLNPGGTALLTILKTRGLKKAEAGDATAAAAGTAPAAAAAPAAAPAKK